MQQSLDSLRQRFLGELEPASTTQAVEALRVHYLGKKGPLQQLMKDLREVSTDQRPHMGKLINDLKEEITTQLEAKQAALIEKEEAEQLEREKIDISLPGRRRFLGNKHVITHTLDKIIDILSQMDFTVQYGPDIESDYYNFEALNFPPDHPARDMQDTFYIDANTLLRTQTTNIQIRLMEKEKPPLRIISPGKAYRNEAITVRSHVFFHQVDALYVDEGVTFSDLLSTMDQFLSKLFEREIKTRYRPSFFPFVEPGLEVDIHCLACDGKGCQLCKYSGWLEIAGAGMVHPEVLKNGGIDPEKYTGFAWGMGVERVALLLYGIKDIRMFTENDLRFLQQFTSI